MKILWLTVCLALLAPIARADDDAVEQAQRWEQVRSMVYAERPTEDAGDAVQISAPYRALDAALVPITIQLDPSKHIVGMSLFVDDNPAPLVGMFHFGPAIAVKQIKTRVRVDAYTWIHVVAETADGHLLTAGRYVKAAGGCSAPSTGQSAEVLARIGQIQLRRVGPLDGAATSAQLLISHPNYNGMQMNLSTRSFIPARYLETVSVTTGGVKVFDLDSSISLSEDPSISFSYTPAGDGSVEVVAKDSTGAVFTRRFDPMSE